MWNYLYIKYELVNQHCNFVIEKCFLKCFFILFVWFLWFGFGLSECPLMWHNLTAIFESVNVNSNRVICYHLNHQIELISHGTISWTKQWYAMTFHGPFFFFFFSIFILVLLPKNFVPTTICYQKFWSQKFCLKVNVLMIWRQILKVNFKK